MRCQGWTPPGSEGVSSVVFIVDDGVFDAPVDRVWKYLESPEEHQHETILSQRVLEQQGNAVKIRAEVRRPDGGKEEQVWHMAMDPPFGFRLEVLEGSTKGSKNVHTYIPMGDRTKVIVTGDFRVQGLDEEATRKATLDYFAMVFAEDNAALKRKK